MKMLRRRDVLGDRVIVGNAVVLRGPVAFPLHRQDFPEVFWISDGRGIHRVNGVEHALRPGTMVFVRASDHHGFGAEDAGLHLTNLAFSPVWLERFRRRHYPTEAAFWSVSDALPARHLLGPSQIARLNREFVEFGLSHARPRDAERLLLNLLHLCSLDAVAGPAAAVPAWLEAALREWAHPDAWVGGTAALAKLAGRSEEHVARVVRQVTGRCPTDLLNAQRMRHAAHLLESTDRTVLDVALECGCASLGHFYALFHQYLGCAPGRYRRNRPVRPV